VANEKYLPQTPQLRRWRLAEEIGEVILEGGAVLQELSKLERFGPDGDPDFREWCKVHGTPRERLLKELDDLSGAIAAVRADLV
jgi:hypothetical protein